MIRFFSFAVTIILTLSVFAQEPGYTNVNATEFNRLINETEGILLDVRTEREYESYHIADSEQMNYYAPNFRQKILELPKDKPIYIYCNVGYRSGLASQILVANGFDKVYNLRQGVLEWHRAGLPLIINQTADADAEGFVSPSDFNRIIAGNERVFFDFYAPWCAPCRQMMPMIDSLKEDYSGKIKIVKINVDVSRDLIRDLNVTGIPLLAFFENGQLVFSHSGLINREDLVRIFDNSLNANN